ncbi:MAG: PIG-L deacetylase family protein [Gemmatimonadota bacterium]
MSRSSDTYVVQACDTRQIGRLAALEMELRQLGRSSGIAARPMARWFGARFGGRAPGAIVRHKRTARYRMPRRLKRNLLAGLCGDDSAGAQNPSIMIIAAHPDDESVGAGSRLGRLSEVYIVHVTDGAPRDPAVARRYGFGTREEYAEARGHELVQAMQLAGVPQERLIHLGYVDGEGAFRMVDLVLDLAQLIDDYAPDIVITHPYEGGHTDHDATAFAVHLACGVLRREGTRPPAVLEMTSYHNWNGSRIAHAFLPHDGADRASRTLVLSEREQQLKQQMYGCFSSQQVVLSTFSTAIERFRPAPRYIFTRPPHEGRLNYERYGDPELGARWRHNAGQALSELRLRPS